MSKGLGQPKSLFVLEDKLTRQNITNDLRFIENHIQTRHNDYLRLFIEPFTPLFRIPST